MKANGMLKHCKNLPIDDEYYTTRKTVEKMYEMSKKYIDRLGVKTILCPFDTEESEFVKFYRDKGYNVIADSGDYEGALEKYKGMYDIIISNPPFSIISKIERRLRRDGINYILLAPRTHVTSRFICYGGCNVLELGSETFKNGKKVGVMIDYSMDVSEDRTLELPVKDEYTITYLYKPYDVKGKKIVIIPGTFRFHIY